MIKTKEVIKFIEQMYNLELYDFQKELVDHLIRGDIIYTPRYCGRSMVYKGYAEYLKQKCDRADYSLIPNGYDKIFTYDEIKNSLIDEDFIEQIKFSHPETFDKEFNCKL